MSKSLGIQSTFQSTSSMQDPFADIQKMDVKIKNILERSESSKPVLTYAQSEFARGMEYNLNYVNRLNLQGERVLDAGCGIGNWSLCLRKSFEEVYALEYNPERLAFAKDIFKTFDSDVIPILGTIEELPFLNDTFDAIFCNGVLFLTDYKQSIKEFERVLKPGGKIYLSYAGIKWWEHLLFNRGPKEPHLYTMTCNVLLNYVSEKCNEILEIENIGLLGILYLHDTVLFYSKLFISGNIKRTIFSLKAIWSRYFKLKRKTETSSIECMNLERVDIKKIEWLARAITRIIEFGTSQQRKELERILEKFIAMEPQKETRRGTSIEIEEMESFLYKSGFSDVFSINEGHLQGKVIPIKPIYKPEWGVYESIACKPKLNVQDFLKPIDKKNKSTILPRNQHHAYNVAETDCLEIFLTKHYQKKLSCKNQKIFLTSIVDSLTEHTRTELDKFLAIYHYLQDRFIHHPTFQFMQCTQSISVDPILLLYFGLGRCGAVAHVAKILFEVAGFNSRVTQLYAHLCCEVFLNNKWHVVDADIFKGGIYPKNKEGQWASLDELELSPILLDALPAVGFQLSRKIVEWSEATNGEAIVGYTDLGLSWERPYLSYLYFGVNKNCIPATPPIFTVVRMDNRQVRVIFKEISRETKLLKLCVDKRSRGWSYEDVPSEKYLSHPKGEVYTQEHVPENGDTTIVLDLPQGEWFFNVCSLNSYSIENSNVYVWPGDEILFKG